MITQSNVSFNGVPLSDVDSRIVVTKITESASNSSRSEVGFGFGIGSHVGREKRTTLDLNVEFGIAMKGRDETSQNVRRQILDSVAAWANTEGVSKKLLAGDHSGQYLLARCVKLFNIGSAREWNTTYQMTFRASEIPYWIDDGTPVTKKNVKKNKISVAVTGNQKTPAFFTFVNTGSTEIGTLKLTCSGKTFSLSGLGLKASESLVVDMNTTYYLQRIRIKGTNGSFRNAYDKLDVSSQDWLWLSPGTCEVSVDAQGFGEITISYKGRYA